MSGPLRCWWVTEVKLWLILILKSVLAKGYIHNAAMYCSGRPGLRMRIRRLKMYLLSASYTGVYHGVRLVLVWKQSILDAVLCGLTNRPTLGTKEIHKDVSILGLTRWNRKRDVAYPEVSLSTRKMLRRFLRCQLRTLPSHPYAVHPMRPTACSRLVPHYGTLEVKRIVKEINQRPRTDVSIGIRG